MNSAPTWRDARWAAPCSPPATSCLRAQELGASPSLIGVMVAPPDGTAIAGAFAAPWLHRRPRPRTVVNRSLWLSLIT
ncbi:hypothetical protein KN815_10680 [Streptomyces sp. 4503]|uniref:Uncharacterized protein n=1 Tax=Streptomyces niphimycinicus TaxID=2842201 RepID=A0ABS6CCD6_9ACTN|nr:hypothetical protein [Streptomyces niphimycinicus]MBU3864524.1 hypothetical protein [Streptomyces niphimycinicus]